MLLVTYHALNYAGIIGLAPLRYTNENHTILKHCRQPYKWLCSIIYNILAQRMAGKFGMSEGVGGSIKHMHTNVRN